MSTGRRGGFCGVPTCPTNVRPPRSARYLLRKRQAEPEPSACHARMSFFMGTLMQDVRFAGRILWKDRGFSLTSLLTVAVCVGTNAAIFAIVNSVLLRPVPVPEPDRLVLMYNSYPRAGVIRASNGVPDYYDRVRETTAFEEQALYDTRGYTVGL